MGSWVGPRAGLDAVVKGKSPCLCHESNPGRQAHSSATNQPKHHQKKKHNHILKGKVKKKCSILLHNKLIPDLPKKESVALWTPGSSKKLITLL
jgi:hypothetical protein